MIQRNVGTRRFFVLAVSDSVEIIVSCTAMNEEACVKEAVALKKQFALSAQVLGASSLVRIPMLYGHVQVATTMS